MRVTALQDFHFNQHITIIMKHFFVASISIQNTVTYRKPKNWSTVRQTNQWRWRKMNNLNYFFPCKTLRPTSKKAHKLILSPCNKPVNLVTTNHQPTNIFSRSICSEAFKTFRGLLFSEKLTWKVKFAPKVQSDDRLADLFIKFLVDLIIMCVKHNSMTKIYTWNGECRTWY